jgi:hypothetical protein
MAYLDLAHPAAAAAIGEPQHRPATRRESGFSAIEWSVIAFARRERLSTLREPGRVARALGGLFGLYRNSRLTDERLEALRRMAVLAWHCGYQVPAQELRAFREAGFSLDQYDALQASIGRGRARNRSHRA